MHKYVKNKPVIIIINLDKSAQKLSNKLEKFLIISNPPINIIRPKVTTICIKSFFFEDITIANKANINIKTPKIEGI